MTCIKTSWPLSTIACQADKKALRRMKTKTYMIDWSRAQCALR